MPSLHHRLIYTTLCSSLLLAGHAWAQPEINPKDVPARVLEVAQKYQSSIACATSEAATQPVLELFPYTTPQDREEVQYAVLWSGDIGCAGGTGTSSANITVVRMGGGNGFFVDAAQSSPNIIFESPVNYIRKVVNYTEDAMTLEGKEYADKDPHCCPSVGVRFTLRADSEGNWLLSEKYSSGSSTSTKK